MVQTVMILRNQGADILFDWRYGTDTRRWVSKDQIETNCANIADSQPYKATRSRPLLTLLQILDLPPESNFVDIGAGKGRVVLIAAECTFRKVVGVEFSGALCEIARSNIEQYSKRKRGLSPMEIIETDATLHKWSKDDCVVFMYNPFHERVMNEFLENLKQSFLTNPRRAWLIYNDPLHDSVVVSAGIFSGQRDYWIGGTQFRVYTT